MSSHDRRVDEIKRSCSQKPSDELRGILATRHEQPWPEELLIAAEEVLDERARGIAAEPVESNPRPEYDPEPPLASRRTWMILLILGVIIGGIGYRRYRQHRLQPVRDFEAIARLLSEKNYREAFALINTDMTLQFKGSEWLSVMPAPSEEWMDLGSAGIGTKLIARTFIRENAIWSRGFPEPADLFEHICSRFYAPFGLFEGGFEVEDVQATRSMMKRWTVTPLLLKDRETRWFLVQSPNDSGKLAFLSLAAEFNVIVEGRYKASGLTEAEFLDQQIEKFIRPNNNAESVPAREPLAVPEERVEQAALRAELAAAQIKRLGGDLQRWDQDLFVELKGERFGDDEVLLLKALPDVKRIWIERTNITDAGLRSLSQVDTLVEIIFYPDAKGLTHAGLQHLGDLRGLQDFVVRDAEITDETVQTWANWKQLRRLGIARSQITDAALPTIGAFNNLEYLDIAGTKVTNDGMAHLSTLGGLTTLDLGSTQVTSTGIARLTTLKLLTDLQLSETKVDDNAVESLASLKALKQLNLFETSITAKGVTTLQAALPDCEILSNVEPSKPEVPQDLLDLLKSSPSMNDKDRQYWIDVYPKLTPEQIENLKQILIKEQTPDDSRTPAE